MQNNYLNWHTKSEVWLNKKSSNQNGHKYQVSKDTQTQPSTGKKIKSYKQTNLNQTTNTHRYKYLKKCNLVNTQVSN